MSRWDDQEGTYHCAAVDANYCRKCWLEFTTLTEKELSNLKKILSRKQANSIVASAKGYMIYYVNEDIYFKTVTEAAIYTKISTNIINNILKGKISKKCPDKKFRYEFY